MNLIRLFSLLLFFSIGKWAVCQPLLSFIDAHGHQVPVKTRAEWNEKRNHILDSMQAAMGPLFSDSGMLKVSYRMAVLPPFNIEVKDSLKSDEYTRYHICFTAAKDETISAYLYIPRKRGTAKWPAMLALHPTGPLGKKIVDGQGPRENRGYAKELAERGYIVIAPDYPGFGGMQDYRFSSDRYASGTMKAIFDNMRCVDLLQARDDVNKQAIGVIGHSLGGHNAIFTAAFDERLKVVVSSCGWTLMSYYNAGKEVTEKYGGALGPWAQEKYMPLLREKYALDTTRIPFDFDGVIASIAPRAFFSNSPLHDGNFSVEGVRVGIDRISEVYELLNAGDQLWVRYPDSSHDFPLHVRLEAYQFVDRVLKGFTAK